MFVGRQATLRALQNATDHHRVVMLTGPGGVGKTRLVREFLNDQSSLVVDFADARTVADGVEAVVRAAGIDTGNLVLDHTGLLTPALAAARDQARWLVLDAVEFLGDSATPFIKLILALDGPRVLLTSRERLTQPPLPVVEVSPLSLQDSCALFDALAGGAMTTATEPLVALLGGVPLAIELAAAQAPFLGAADLAARVDELIDLLADPGRRGRHESMAACVSWSWGMLSDREQRMLRLIAASQCGLGFEAIEAIDTGPGHPLHVVRDLARKSWIQIRRAPSPRAVLFDTTRMWLDKTTTAELRSEAKTAVHGWLSDWAATVASDHDGMLFRTLPVVQPEAANLEAVVCDPAADPVHVARAARLLLNAATFSRLRQVAKIGLEHHPDVDELQFAWGLTGMGGADLPGGVDVMRGLADSGSGVVSRDARYILAVRLSNQRDVEEADRVSASLLAQELPAVMRTRVLVVRSMLRMWLGDLGESAAAIDEAVEVGRRSADREAEVKALSHRLRLAVARRETANATITARRIGALLPSIDAGSGVGGVAARVALATWSVECADYAGAVRWADEGLARCRPGLDIRYQLQFLMNRGLCHFVADELDAAEATWQRCVILCEHLSLEVVRASLLVNLAICAARAGQIPQAEGFLAEGRLCDPSDTDALEWAVGEAYVAVAGATDSSSRTGAVAHARSIIHRAQALSATDLSLRVVVRALERLLQGTVSPDEELVIGPQSCWVRLPQQGGEIDLTRRGSLRLMLDALMGWREQQPTDYHDVDDLFEAGWPGETIAPDHAAHRVHTTLNRLRHLGFSTLLERSDDGYRLSPAVPIRRSEAGKPEEDA